MIIGIQHGNIEPIVVVAVDLDNKPVVGKTDIVIRMRRQTDGKYFDWSDNTFKDGASVGLLLQPLVEVSPVYSKGEYQLSTVDHVRGLDTSKIVNPNNDDIYFVFSFQNGGEDVANMPQFCELRVGTFIIADHTPLVF
jgi:hypothetical protein